MNSSSKIKSRKKLKIAERKVITSPKNNFFTDSPNSYDQNKIFDLLIEKVNRKNLSKKNAFDYPFPQIAQMQKN